MDDLIERLPKAELHLHLEGTISPETLWAMAAANHVALPVSSFPELQGLYRFTSFDSFIELWLLMCSCLRTGSDYERMVDGFLASAPGRTSATPKLHFTPYNHERLGIGGRRALEIVSRKLMSSESAGGPVVRLITDISGESPARARRTQWSCWSRRRTRSIVALGLGGPRGRVASLRFGLVRARAQGRLLAVGATREKPAAPSTYARPWWILVCAAWSTARGRWKTPPFLACWRSGGSAATSP